ncbi:thymidylate kinase [Microbacterium phage Nucci]|nr:thymidylate kinase [Microbacterium phage Nucci]QXO13636.1 thymidylate kinase [Microbacterium phage Mandalorian]
MLIAFEGPDETGKSTSAQNLAWSAGTIYNANKDNYAQAQADVAEFPDAVITFDRIDWLTHMVYRLSLPGFEWNDDRVRTVFAMPDTHLVLKTHRLTGEGQLAAKVEAVGEGYQSGNLDTVTQTYYHFTDWLAAMNQMRDFSLFKTISVMEVHHNQETGEFTQRLVVFSAPGFPWGTQYEKLVHDDESLLELLRYADQHIG